MVSLCTQDQSEPYLSALANLQTTYLTLPTIQFNTHELGATWLFAAASLPSRSGF